MGKLENIEKEMEAAKKRMEQVREKKRRFLVKERSKQRKLDTKVKIIIGALFLKHFGNGIRTLIEKASERDKAFVMEWADNQGVDIGTLNESKKED